MDDFEPETSSSGKTDVITAAILGRPTKCLMNIIAVVPTVFITLS